MMTPNDMEAHFSEERKLRIRAAEQAKLRAARRQALDDAARAVCIWCADYNTPTQGDPAASPRVIWWHEHPTDPRRCWAGEIWTLIAREEEAE